jgi:hypothetical protein
MTLGLMAREVLTTTRPARTRPDLTPAVDLIHFDSR